MLSFILLSLTMFPLSMFSFTFLNLFYLLFSSHYVSSSIILCFILLSLYFPYQCYLFHSSVLLNPSSLSSASLFLCRNFHNLLFNSHNSCVSSLAALGCGREVNTPAIDLSWAFRRGSPWHSGEKKGTTTLIYVSCSSVQTLSLIYSFSV